MVTSRGLIPKGPLQDCCCQCPSPNGETLLTHTSTGDPPTLAGSSGSVTCGVTASFLWVFSSVQSLSHVRLVEIPWTAALQASPSFTNSQSLFKLMPMGVGDAIQSSHPLSSPSPPAFNLSVSWCAQDFVCALQDWSLCFLQSCGSPIIKFHWTSRPDSQEIPSLSVRSPGWKA